MIALALVASPTLAQAVSINDIQYTADPSGDSPYKDQVGVTTEGIVTAVFYNGYFIEESTGGAWSGLFVYDTSSPSLGDHLSLTGTVNEYYGLTQLKTLTNYQVLSSGNALPAPEILPSGSVGQEQWESVLVRVEEVTVTDDDLGYGEWSVSDSSGDVVIDDKGSYTYIPTTGDFLAAIIGPLDYAYGAFKIQPRNDGDVITTLYTPIYDIQYTSDPSGDSPYKDQVDVTTEGVVTAVLYNGYFIEEPTGGAWSGLFVYDSNGPAPGDYLSLTGTVSEYYGLTQLKTLTDYQVLSSGNALPAPEVLPSGSVSQEQWESVLVRVENVTVTDDSLGYGEWSVSDGSGDVVVDDKGSYTYIPTTGNSLLAVIGPLDYTYGAFKIQPRDDNDVLLPQPPDLVINEFLADPATDLTGDANGDGVRHYGDDEFVEIANVSDSPVDISGWTLSDGYSVRHVFPAGTVIPADCAIVVFGGGSPSGVFGEAMVQTASTGALGLNNSGDTITLNDGGSDRAAYEYGSEGGDDQSLTRDPDTGGPFVKHSTATGSGGALFSPGTLVDGSQFAGCNIPFVCGDPATPIHDVQGNGAESPLKDTFGVTIEGVVVGDFQTSDHLRGFFVQEENSDADGDAATSEGVFVYDGSSPAVDVSTGDLVRIKGTVVEYYGLTQLGSVSKVAVCGTGSAVTPAGVTLPVASLDEWEQYEGMLINFPQTLYATGNYYLGRYGEVDLSVDAPLDIPTSVLAPGAPALALQDLNDRSRIQLEDGSTVQNPAVTPYINADGTLRTGDSIPGLTGVLSYAFGTYEVQPTADVVFTATNPRPVAPPDLGEPLVQVAGANVLNYFTTLDDSGPICGPGGDMGCRGADTLDEFNRQKAKLVSALTSLDADIFGLIEVENSVDDTPIEDLVAGLNSELGAGTYAYVATGAIGTDAVRNGIVYKPGAVTEVGSFAVLDSSVDPMFIDNQNRPTLAQTFSENSTGQTFTVVVNHLRSKGSSCAHLGDPDLGDGQGNCNLVRTWAAEALVDWLATDPTASGDTDFLIIGDLNAYAMEDPVEAILSSGYADLVNTFVGSGYTSGAYSYNYSGQAGYLDHALASPNLVPFVVGTAIWHNNADEPAALDYNDHNPLSLYQPGEFRASDHDAILVGLFADADQDGVIDQMDMCPGTTIPESAPTLSLGVNRFALVDGDFEFDTLTLEKKLPLASFDTAKTGGCSCEQIIEAQGLGRGHMKFGCSVGEILDWVELVGQP